MKKSIWIVVTVLLVIYFAPTDMFGIVTNAMSEGVYTYTVSNGEVSIDDCSTEVSGNLEIPTTLGGYPVTTIKWKAFAHCDSLMSIRIPVSINNIAPGAFSSCNSLESIVVDLDNQYYCSVDGILFDKEKTTLISFPSNASFSSYEVPNSVNEIEYCAFSGCDKLFSVSIPDSVTVLGWYAFDDCINIQSIMIPQGVETIGHGVFRNCKNLVEIAIPSSVDSFYSEAFMNCFSLETVYYGGAEDDWSSINKDSWPGGQVKYNSYNIKKYGCVGNLDTDIDITDWDGVLLARYLAGWDVDIFNVYVLDIDGDGVVTDWDGVIFDRCLAGWKVDSNIGQALSNTITYFNTKDAANLNPNTYRKGNNEIVLFDLEKIGYVFEGWYNKGQKISAISANSSENYKLTAKWSLIEYQISYEDIKGCININPIQYNVEDADIVLSELSRNGYTFAGWYLEDEKVTTLPKGSTGDLTLKAHWKLNDYNINYNNTKGAVNNNPKKFNVESETIILQELEKEGYIFNGWYKGEQKITQITSGTMGNLTLDARWTPIQYSLKYENTPDTPNYNPITYTIESENIELLGMEKIGYVFEGWYKGNEKITVLPTGTTGDLVLRAQWKAIEYTIIYTNSKGANNSNPQSFNIDSETIVFAELEKEGYIFNGWYSGERRVSEITKGTIGDIVLTAKWTPKIFTATFVANGKTIDTCEFTMEEEKLSSVPVVPSKEHYRGGWEEYNLLATDLVINAVYTPIEYKITYINTQSVANENPLTYNIESEFLLKDIEKAGYKFEGWYHNSQKMTSMERGNFGDITLEAKWSLVEYDIIYHNTKNLPNENEVSFNVESKKILLKPLSHESYIFEGWYMDNEKVDSIKTGTTGVVELTAKWTPIKFNISYIDTKKAINNNPTTYTVEDEIILDALAFNGYTFDGWYIGDELIESIKVGTIGDIELTARWSLTEYTISFASRYGGTMPISQTYTVESGTVSLSQAPSNSNYVFVGWNYNGEKVDTISSSIQKNITVYAMWAPKYRYFSNSEFEAYGSYGYGLSGISIERYGGGQVTCNASGYYIVPLHIWGTLYDEQVMGYVYVKGKQVSLLDGVGVHARETYMFVLSNFTSSSTVSTDQYSAKVPAIYYSVW